MMGYDPFPGPAREAWSPGAGTDLGPESSHGWVRRGMTHFHLFDKNRRSPERREPSEASGPEPVPNGSDSFSTLDLENWEEPVPGRSIQEKLSGAMVGLRQAVRGDSSFFAHAYRGLLIALTAIILGAGPVEWCFLMVSASLVLGSEFFHSALDRLSRCPALAGDRDVQMAREIAAGAVLVAAIISGVITLTVLTTKLGALLG